MIRSKSRVFLRVLAEEAGIRKLHDACDLADRQCGAAQVVLELCNRDIGNPFSGGLPAAFLANLREVFRRNAQLLCVPLYLALVRELLQQSREFTEGIIALVDGCTLVFRMLDNANLSI